VPLLALVVFLPSRTSLLWTLSSDFAPSVPFFSFFFTPGVHLEHA
jgi:hypothetical protein